MTDQSPALPAGLRLRCTDPELAETARGVASRVHPLTLMPFGPACGAVELVVERGDGRLGAHPRFAEAVHASLSVRLNRGRGQVVINTSHRDGTQAITQAFARAQRELMRRLNGGQRRLGSALPRPV